MSAKFAVRFINAHPIAHEIRMTNTAEKVRLLKADDLCEILQITKRSLYHKVADGSIPRPIKLGGSSRWRSDVIEEWISNDCQLVG